MSIIYHKRYKIFTEHVHLLSKNNLLKSLLNCSSRLEKKNLKLRSWKTLPFHSVQKISYISFCFYTFPESDSCERDRLQFQFDQSQVWCEELRYKQNSRTLSYLGGQLSLLKADVKITIWFMLHSVVIKEVLMIELSF